MRAGRRETWAIAGAVTLHATALSVFATFGGGSPAVASVTRSTEPSWFDVELDDGTIAENATRVPDVVPGAGALQLPRTVARSFASKPASRASGPAAVASEERGEADMARSEGAPSREPIDLGIGSEGWQRWMSPLESGEAARTDSKPQRRNRFHIFHAPPASTTGGLQEGLEEQDHARGLGPSGRVLSVLHEAAHVEIAPVLGTARFDVTVTRAGVVDVALRAASGDVEKWRKVAAHIERALRAAPPRIPSAREGVKLVVELVAEETMPNGTKVTALAPAHLDAPAWKLKSGELAKEQLRADNPTTENPNGDTLPATIVEQPGLYVAGRGKVIDLRAGLAVLPPAAQSYREGVTPLGLTAQGHFEPSHLGAKPQRTVHARVIEQSMF